MKNTTEQNHVYDAQNHVYDAQNAPVYYGEQSRASRPIPSNSIALLLYCPQNLDLRAELLRSGNRLLIKHLWKFYYVITLLYLHRWNKSSEADDFRPLMAKVLRRSIGNNHAGMVLGVLKLLRIIESDNHYVVGEHSKGYRLCEPYRSASFRQIKPTELPHIPSQAIKHCRQRIETNGSHQHLHLLNTLREVTLDDSSHDLTERYSFASSGEFDYHLRSAEFIRLGQWFFSYDKCTGRVFNNITSFPRELRPYLRLDGKSFVELDVKNCQPFLLLDLYSDEPERKRFAEIVCAGQFYESLDKQLAVPFGESCRDKLKEAVYSQILFDRVRPTPTKLNQAFRQAWPALNAHIINLKAGNHCQLALHLQKLEAQLIIGGVVREIALSSKFPVLTIHDSILSLRENVCEVRALLMQTFNRKFGCVPHLREKLLSVATPSKTIVPRL